MCSYWWCSYCWLLLSLSSKLQAVLLQHQSFLQKCEAWMDFLSQTEQKLGAEISGNYQSLLEQQRDHEVRGILFVYGCLGAFNVNELCVLKFVVEFVQWWCWCFFCLYTCSCSMQRCSADSRFCTPLSAMGITCWTKDMWMTGKDTHTDTWS